MLMAFCSISLVVCADEIIRQCATRTFAPLAIGTKSAGFNPSTGVQLGYCNTDGPVLGVGSSAVTERKGVIYLPAEQLAPYAGKKVTQVLVGLNAASTDLKPLIMKSLGTDLLNEEGCDGAAGWNTLTLSEPYVLDGGELYVGYSCVGDYSMGLSSTYNDNGLWLFDSSGWNNYALSQGWGALCVRFVIEGEDFPVDLKLSVDEIGAQPVGATVSVSGCVESMMLETVESYEIECSLNGVSVAHKVFNTSLATNEVEDFLFQIPSFTKAGVYNLTLSVASVNGVADAIPINSTANFSVKARSRTFNRRIVVEEGTATWCGWCVYGIAGMRKMKEKYPDGYIGIAIHDGDQMAGATNYNEIFKYFSGLPACIINRQQEYMLYPRFENMESVYLKEKENADAAIEAEAVFTDAERSKVTVKTQSQFGYDDNHEHRIAYVVLENGVGPYDQTNYVSGGQEDVGGFESQSSPVNMLFDDVARGIYGGYDGVENSVPAQVSEGALYDYSYTLELPDNISNKDNIEIVAMLIDCTTGEIMNACKTEVKASTAFLLTYVVDGEKYKTVEMEAGASITPEAAPEKEGYTFVGWEGLPETMPDENVTVTGVFSVNSYTLVYMVNGKEYARQTVAYGAQPEDILAPEVKGHTFVGWEGLPETMPAGDVTVTGVFTVNSYDLIYMVDGEEYTRHAVKYGTVLEAEAAPEKDGYTFTGWEGLPETMPDEDVTVTGAFTVNFYALIYMVDGEEYARESVEYGTALSTLEVPAAPEKEGHTFNGWEDLPETMPAGDVTVTGVFTVNSYTLTYYLDGEVYATETVEYGASIVPPVVADTEEYIFNGWQEVPETMPAHDVTVRGTTRPTGILGLTVGDVVDVYDLRGVLLRKGVAVERLRMELPAGMYVVDGRKLWIRK